MCPGRSFPVSNNPNDTESGMSTRFLRQLEYTGSKPGANMQIPVSMPCTRKDVLVVLPFCVLLLGLTGVAQARVTQITITKTAPAFNGQSFGKVGAYEVVRGTATGEFDPADR